MNAPPCSQPIDNNTLADYWLAELPPAEQEAVELHLLQCDECSGRLQEISALADGIRDLARRGSLRLVVSEGFLERMIREGLHVREYAPPAGGGVACTVTPSDNLLMSRFAADLTGARRVDLAFCDAGGMELSRMRDIPVDAVHREVLVNQPIDQIRKLPATTLIARLLAVDETGERLLGEYAFHHTPTPG